MKIGVVEIIYLKKGWEGASPNSKIAIGWALRRYYLTMWLRIRPNFFRHLIFGFHIEGIEFLHGISK
jgi:hypothetical protein